MQRKIQQILENSRYARAQITTSTGQKIVKPFVGELTIGMNGDAEIISMYSALENEIKIFHANGGYYYAHAGNRPQRLPINQTDTVPPLRITIKPFISPVMAIAALFFAFSFIALMTFGGT